MTAALESDEDFRQRVAVQVNGGLPRPVAESADLDADNPATAAALAWLVRPEGWEDALDAASPSLPSGRGHSDDAEVDRLRQQVESAEKATRDLRSRYREEVAELKARTPRCGASWGRPGPP